MELAGRGLESIWDVGRIEQPLWPALPDGIAKVLGGREEACAQAAEGEQSSGQFWGGKGVLRSVASASVC